MTRTVRSSPCRRTSSQYTFFVWGVPVSRDTYGGSGFEGIGRDAQLWLDVELEGARDPFDAEQVIAIRGDFNLELVWLILGVVRVRHRLHREKRSVIQVHHDDDDEGISSKELGKLGTHVLVEFESILEAQLVKVLGRCVCERVQRSVSQSVQSCWTGSAGGSGPTVLAAEPTEKVCTVDCDRRHSC